MRIAGQVAFALLFSANAVAIFGHGWFGTGSLFTAAYLATFIAVLFLLGGRQAITPTVPDYLAIGFFACSAVSIALHPPSDPKQLPLFVLSLAGYVAARRPSERILGAALVIPLITVVAAGTIVTLYTLATQPAGVYGKLEIFGQFGHATTKFTILLSVGLLPAGQDGSDSIVYRFADRSFRRLTGSICFHCTDNVTSTRCDCSHNRAQEAYCCCRNCRLLCFDRRPLSA
jgi:hypothetical protein